MLNYIAKLLRDKLAHKGINTRFCRYKYLFFFYKQNFDIKIYPNPITNNDLIIDFDLEQKSNIEIDIFDVIGNKILNLYKGPGSTGKNSINSHLPFSLNQGIYLIRLKTAQGIKTKKVAVAY